MNINKYTIPMRIFTMISLLFFCSHLSAQQNRTFDGAGNNLANPDWGAAHSNLVRETTIAYDDLISSPAGVNRPNPRTISNVLFAQNGQVDDPLSLSNYIWVFGQFIDHDIDLTPGHATEFAMVDIPAGDPVFDPTNTGIMVIPMKRSEYDPSTGTSINNPREHPNEITSFIDASAVYGSDQTRADWLRTFSQGKLKTSAGDLLPFGTLSGESADPYDANSPHMDDDVGQALALFIAGDSRANENVCLTAMHTLFVREHNRLCNEIFIANPGYTDEQIYQKARKIVGGQLQAITYEEWLPSMGLVVPAYTGYDPNVNAGIMNIFSGAAFRMGHSLLTSEIPRIDNSGNVIPEGNLMLREAFFNPDLIINEGGLDPIMKGMAEKTMQDFDCQVIDDVRNFLFGQPGSGGLDLPAININRGRERGFADYNTIRTDFGLPAVSTFAEINDDPAVMAAMSSAYPSVNDIDPWVGMLAEKHLPNTLFGETVHEIMKVQFLRLRDGDRFYYENDPGLTAAEKVQIKNTKLVDIILRNTGINLMQGNIFTSMDHNTLVNCGAIVPNATVSGSFMTSYGALATNVDLAFTNSINGVTQAFADANGTYEFSNIPTCYAYEIIPSKTGNHANGVTTYDIVVIQNHILGLSTMNSPYRLIAADVNNNGAVTTADIVTIRSLILGIIDEFPLVDAWRFVPSNFSFTDPTNPFLDNFPEKIEITNLTNNGIFDFIAIKPGDVSGSANPNVDAGSQSRSFSESLLFAVDDKIISPESNIVVDFKAEDLNAFLSYQFTIDYNIDKLRFKAILPGELNQLSEGNFGIFERHGMITTSWDGSADLDDSKVLFSLEFEGLDHSNLRDELSISSRKTSKEAVRTNGELYGVDLKFIGEGDDKILSENQMLYQNYPNPFSDETMVSYYVPGASQVNIQVVDGLGRIIKEYNQDSPEGYHELIIKASDLGSPGIYTLELNTDFGKASRQLIFIK